MYLSRRAAEDQNFLGSDMLRLGLIAYLMVGTLAGPAWCCCTFERLTTWSTTNNVATTKAKSHCCSHHQHVPAHDEKDADKSSDRTRPAPKEAPCPCKEQRNNEAAAVTLTVQEARDSRWLTDEFNQANPLFMPLGWVSPALAQSDGSHPSAPDGAGLSGRQILCAFQVFRC